jgi:hypothetical protein
MSVIDNVFKMITLVNLLLYDVDRTAVVAVMAYNLGPHENSTFFLVSSVAFFFGGI